MDGRRVGRRCEGARVLVRPPVGSDGAHRERLFSRGELRPPSLLADGSHNLEYRRREARARGVDRGAGHDGRVQEEVQCLCLIRSNKYKLKFLFIENDLITVHFILY